MCLLGCLGTGQALRPGHFGISKDFTVAENTLILLLKFYKAKNKIINKNKFKD